MGRDCRDPGRHLALVGPSPRWRGVVTVAGGCRVGVARRALTADIDAADPAIVTTDDTARYIKAAAENAALLTLIENLRMELLINRDNAPIFAEDVAQ